jgi:hypothetical protein
LRPTGGTPAPRFNRRKAMARFIYAAVILLSIGGAIGYLMPAQ